MNGAVVDLASFAGSARIAALNAQADLAANAGCVYAKNLVASGIKDVVTKYRTANPGMKYVVLVGGDATIPFFRYPDQNELGPESDYIPPVRTTSPSEASLRSDYVLGQDEYGSSVSISLGTYAFPIPELAVGRLVETAAEASAMLDAYGATTNGVVATPTTSLVTGYDFFRDGAESVKTDLNAGTGKTADTLFAANGFGEPVAGAWTGTQLKTAVTGSRHDLIFMGGHFSANEATAADFVTKMTSTDVASSSVNLVNSIVFSAGCHSGYNIVDGDQTTGTQPVDFAQAFARKGATLIAGTGYQYGDDELVEYGERIYAEFAHQLRIGSTGQAVALGQALLKAKQIYLASTPDIRVLHAKSIIEATLFGLPMLSVNMPTGRIPAPTPDPGVTPTNVTSGAGSAFGLQAADVTLSTPTNPGSPTSTNGTYLSGATGITANVGAPILPLQVKNATATNGTVLKGVGFMGGAYSDTANVDPLLSDVSTLVGDPAPPEFASSFFVPAQIWRSNYFDALGGGTTKHLVMPARHKSDDAHPNKSIRRTYSNVKLKLFYSSFTGDAALAAAPAITNIQGILTGSTVNVQATVTGDPSAGIQSVWIVWTGGGGASDSWKLVNLTAVEGNPTLFTGSFPLPSGGHAADLRFIVEAVNGAGLVTIADNLGAYNRVFDASAATTAAAATKLVLSGTPTSGAAGGVVTASATLTAGGVPVANQTITFQVGTAQATGVTGSNGVATATVPLGTGAGGALLSASFAGDIAYQPSGDSRSLSVTKGTSTLTLSGPATPVVSGGISGVTATLKADGGAPIPFKTVWFVLSGPTPVVVTATTGLDGKARLVPTPAVNGTYSVIACFDKPDPQGACPLGTASDDSFTGSVSNAASLTVWLFTGFFAPVDNLPTVNSAKAGSTVPIKFSLGGNRGLTGIFAAGSPVAVPVSCSSTAPIDDIDETTTQTAALSYDVASGQYQFNWKTPKNFAGTCQRLDVRFFDGTTYSALFKFK